MKFRNLKCALALGVVMALSGCGDDEEAPAETRATGQQAEAETQPAPAAPTRETARPMGAEADEAAADDVEAMPDASSMADVEESAASAADPADPCSLTIEAGDTIAYSHQSLSAPSSCDSVTVTLHHTGQLPAAAMGHNWVLIPADAVQAIGTAGPAAGAEKGYVPDDDRVIAATDLVGGGESASVTFSLSDLESGTDYMYICTFPGHWTLMQGTFKVE